MSDECWFVEKLRTNANLKRGAQTLLHSNFYSREESRPHYQIYRNTLFCFCIISSQSFIRSWTNLPTFSPCHHCSERKPRTVSKCRYVFFFFLTFCLAHVCFVCPLFCVIFVCSSYMDLFLLFRNYSSNACGTFTCH